MLEKGEDLEKLKQNIYELADYIESKINRTIDW